MESLPPLQVTVDSKSWSCVLDLRLALAQHGPMLALRLAEELRICLVPRLWYVLDHTDHYQHRMETLLRGAGDDASMRRVDPQALDQWERARLELGLSALRLYWVGDALHESFLPKDVDPQVVDRFDRFARGLQCRFPRLHNDRSETPLVGGSLDAAALAAALSRHRPLILTLAGDSDEAPELCTLLQASDIPCRRLSSEESEPLRRQLLGSFARSGALELCWAGLHLALVHLVVPRAYLVDTDSDDAVDDEAPLKTKSKRTDVWAQASAYWYSLP